MKTKKQNSAAQIKELREQYILNAIDSEVYEVKIIDNNERDKIKFIINTFKQEYGYTQNIQRYGSYQKTFENWMMGLPSCLNIDYEYHKIIQIAKQWGCIPQDASTKQEDKICANWFGYIYMGFKKLMDKHGLTYQMTN